MFRELITDELLAAFCAEFKTTLTKAQGDAWRLIATEFDALAIDDIRMLSYVLGTCWHECRFRSIREIRALPGTSVFQMQEKYWHTGYYGRGYCQLTWKKNYAKFSPLVGRDLVRHPDDILLPEIGAKILVSGMWFGLFSGKKLKDYFLPQGEDWIKARRIVNGNFQADRVATSAKRILGLLTRSDI